MSSILKKYSKPSGFYFNTKASFFSENEKLLNIELKKNQLYGEQPLRTHCKICRVDLPLAVDFISHGVGYKFCEQCSHLNGAHEDTKGFIEKLYISDDGSEYSKNYVDENYQKRSQDIYLPKVDFLIESLKGKDYTILDIGCGSGYFVNAAIERNIHARGLDISKSMVSFGNSQIKHSKGKEPMEYVGEAGFYQSIIDSKEHVISAIGVIEHLREPHQFFEAFQQSEAQILYYSVPMFSNSVFLEFIHQEVFPRQLSGGHTHLFLEESIKKMNSIIGVTPIAEWRFGTDVMDLYRIMMNRFNQVDVSDKFKHFFEEGFKQNIDGLQSVFDQNHFCSEIHLVGKKIKN